MASRQSSDPAAPTALEKILLARIRAAGRITFREYMQFCLYHPEHGYYMQGRQRTGRAGDFFTSADLHPIFARLVGRQVAEMWERLGSPGEFTLVEMGAGRGLFAQDFLAWAHKKNPRFAHSLRYVLVEPGARQRELAMARLSQAGFSKCAQAVSGLEELPPLTGCFFSNELVDSFPVAVVTRQGGRLKEIYVTVGDSPARAAGRQGETFRETVGPLSDARVAHYAARYAPELDEGCRLEVNLAALDWLRAVAQRLARGFVLTVDYGDLAPRLYIPQRPRGTLLAFRAHVASEKFLEAPGEQDLTSQVNFSALMDAGPEQGLETTGFTTQEKFLLALGESDEFADLYEPGSSESEKLQSRLQLKRLIYPEDMGTAFKVLIQHQGVVSPQLSGLKFAR